MRGEALAVLVLLWALSRSQSAPAAAPAAAPGAAPPAPPRPTPTLPPIDSKSPGVPQKTPPRATRVPWSESTMRLFAREMRSAGVDPELALKAIAAASDFDPGSYLGNNVGLLMVRRDHLREAGYTGVELYSLPAEEQIPWIGKVIAYRIASTGDTPQDVGDLAVLINPVPEKMDAVLRNEAKRRTVEAERTRFYRQHAALLQRVQQGDQ